MNLDRSLYCSICRSFYRAVISSDARLGRLFVIAGIGLFLAFSLARPAAAAEYAASDTVYVLPQGEVIADDLYVVAPEIVINGIVEGDLLASGAYIEINGAINGSLMGAAAGVQINGVVQNSVRVAALSVTLDGAVRKDFLATAGFGVPRFPDFPIPIRNRAYTPGIQLTRNSSISGDVLLSGSSARVAGVIGGDLAAMLKRLDLSGRTDGNADIRAETLRVQDAANIGGILTYTSRETTSIPDHVAAGVVVQPWESVDGRPAPVPVNPIWQFFGWLWRLAIQLIGLGLIAWLVWAFAPRVLRQPAAMIEARPVEAGLYGFVATVILAPLSFALIFLGVLFWGWFPGGVGFSAAAFGLLSIAWLLSPVVTGMWVGRRIVQVGDAGRDAAPRSELQALLLGILAIVLVANVVGAVPCVGPVAERIVYVLSLALAIGGILLARLRPTSPASSPLGAEA